MTEMKKNGKPNAILAQRIVLAATAALAFLAAPTLWRGEATAQDAGVSTLQSEMLTDLAQVRDKYVGLAGAMPESSYGWRPAEGVRSVSEVYMHIVAANIGIVASTLGEAPPEDADPMWYDFANAESITDKETIGNALAASFDYVAEVIEGSSGARLEEPVNLFGQETTVRAALLLVLTHCHEHLGQSIAYARSNDVTPPWSGG